MDTNDYVTEEQKKQYFKFVENAGNQALSDLELDGDSLQRLLKNSYGFRTHIVTAIRKFSANYQFELDEEFIPSYKYPDNYKVKDIIEQVRDLRQLFPELESATFDESISARPLPPNAEGWFAIPRWERFGSTYYDAVNNVLMAIECLRPFHNSYGNKPDPRYIRQRAKTIKTFQKIGNEQKEHDILIVPCQFGLRHRGRSICQSLKKMSANEFGLGAFAVGCMILTHPKREVKWEQLHIICAGDESAPPGSFNFFSVAPYFDFSGNKICYTSFLHDIESEYYGSASGFLL